MRLTVQIIIKMMNLFNRKHQKQKEKPKETELQNDSKDNKEQQRDTLEKQESRPKKTNKNVIVNSIS